MIVLFDVEWITAADGGRSMTQLAALRTNAAWEPCAEFHTLVSPAEYNADWEQVAYNGYSPDEFRAAPDERDALLEFLRWLKKGDILCCWHYENGKTLDAVCKYWTGTGLPYRWAAANQTVYDWFARKGITDPGGLYNCARLRGLQLPVPEHDSCHDTAVLQQLLAELHLSGYFLRNRRKPKLPQAPQEPVDRRKQNAAEIIRRQYHYVYLPASPVFHRWDCKLVLNSTRILGCTRYKTAAKHRRPCLVCRPEPGLLTAQESARREEILQREQYFAEQKKIEARRNEVVNARLLGGAHIEIRRKLLVGFCHNQIHPGKMTRQLMEEHDCLGKECRFFEKYEDASYWRDRARKTALKQHVRQQKKAQKEQQQQQENTGLSCREVFQSYIDEIGYSMKIVRVQKEKKVFTVFYVSEYPFPDGNRFPDFLNRVWHENAGCRVILRHIQDMSGHFVTIDEYAQIKR